MDRNQAAQEEAKEATRFGSSQPNIAKSAGTGEDIPRKQASPSIEINKARTAIGADGTSDPSDRVADAGDAGGRTIPFDIGIHDDALDHPNESDRLKTDRH